MVLVHHVVDLPLVHRVGEVPTKDRPQVIVLGGVVTAEALSKLAPTLDHLVPTLPIFQDVELCLDIGHVTPQGVVQGEHEADISPLVARRGAPSPRPQQDSDGDAEDGDQRDYQRRQAVVSCRHQMLLLFGTVVSPASAPPGTAGSRQASRR
jgi:hypothetical protein